MILFQFLRNTGGSHLESQSVNLTFEEYYGGNFFLAWDRTKSRDNRFRKTLPDSGSMSLNLKAEAGLDENYVLIVYATYSSSLVLDGETVTTETF